MMSGGLAYEPTYAEKAGQLQAEKQAIAELALELIKPGDSIVLGPGTTTLSLARLLPRIGELTVVTNSLLVAEALAGAAHDRCRRHRRHDAPLDLCPRRAGHRAGAPGLCGWAARSCPATASTPNAG